MRDRDSEVTKTYPSGIPGSANQADTARQASSTYQGSYQGSTPYQGGSASSAYQSNFSGSNYPTSSYSRSQPSGSYQGIVGYAPSYRQPPRPPAPPLPPPLAPRPAPAPPAAKPRRALPVFATIMSLLALLVAGAAAYTAGVIPGVGGTKPTAGPTGSPDSSAPIVTAPPGTSPNVTALAQLALPRTVQIVAIKGEQAGYGSGFLYREPNSDRTLVITNRHVAPPSDGAELTVILNDDTEYEVEPVGSSRTYDLAVLELVDPPADLPTVEFGDSDAVEVGAFTMAVGSPGGRFQQTVTTGIVSHKNRAGIPGSRDGPKPQVTPDGTDFAVGWWIQTDAAINPGNSGGPLFDQNGRVIGVNSAGNDSMDAVGFSIPSNAVKRVIPDLISKGKVSMSTIGATDMADDNVALNGAQLTGISKSGSFGSAGITDDDEIVRVNGFPIANPIELIAVVRYTTKPGDKIPVIVMRDGSEQEIQVTLQGKDTTP